MNYKSHIGWNKVLRFVISLAFWFTVVATSVNIYYLIVFKEFNLGIIIWLPLVILLYLFRDSVNNTINQLKEMKREADALK